MNRAAGWLIILVSACGAELDPTGERGPALRRRADAKGAIVAGISHSCATRLDGTVRCWGLNGSGQLGNGSTSSSNTPVAVSGLTHVVAIALGSGTSVALRSDGTVWRWGTDWGTAGHPFNTTPVQVSGLSNILAIGSGDYFTCAVREDGRVFCWGSGQLGDGVTTESATPVQVANITTAVSVAAGNHHGCALLVSGAVRCWGLNSEGELGDGTFNDSPTPTTVTGISSAIDVSAGSHTSCAALANGTARCWGSNSWGQLGGGSLSPEESNTPVTVAGLSSVVAIDNGWSNYVCALRSDGTMRCWGITDSGQHGNGVSGIGAYSLTPVSPTGLSAVVDFSAGGHTCALRSDGTGRCFGHNIHGQLGNGNNTQSTVPVTVSGLSGAIAAPKVSSGPHHTCALRSNGTVKCWGDNDQGQLGNGNQIDSTTPILVPNLSAVIDLGAGGSHTCALLSSGSVSCFGRNASGELGDGGASGSMSLTPVTVSGLTDAVSITAGQQNTCAVRANGTARCWGSNSYGQLGNGTYTDSSVPVTVSGLTGVVSLDINNIHACAVLVSGEFRCWGYNFYGQLGNGTSGGNSNVPVTVSTFIFPLTGGVAVAVGNSHSCGVLYDGSARCWGAGFNGALGHGSYDSETRPVVVSNLSDAVDISAGSSSTCAIRSNGAAKCWGTNTYGELGYGSGPGTNTPVSVGVFPFYLALTTSLDSGFDHSCVTRGDGTMACWGLNNHGQLGDGTTINRTTPVAVTSFP